MSRHWRLRRRSRSWRCASSFKAILEEFKAPALLRSPRQHGLGVGAIVEKVMAPLPVVVLAPLEEIVAPALLEDAKVPVTLVEAEVEAPPPL